MSATQFDTIIQLLQQIQQPQSLLQPTPNLFGLSGFGGATGEASPGSIGSGADNREEDRLTGCIDRLYCLAEKEGKTVYSDEAQDVIADLETILEAISADKNRKSHSGDGDENLRKCQWESSEMEQGIVSRDLKRIKGLLATSQAVTLNPNG
jgi:hypothetical protein